MRVSAQTKLATESAIRAAARALFARQGVHATSTREIATACGIAVGTLFNYFPSKEALATALMWEALEPIHEPPAHPLTPASPSAGGTSLSATRTLDEHLFAIVARDLRALEPLRGYIHEILDPALSPVAEPISPEAAWIRTYHMEAVSIAIARFASSAAVTEPTINLYWSLYLGVLSYWSRDPSPGCQNSLAMLDQGMKMFARSILAAPAMTGDSADSPAASSAPSPLHPPPPPRSEARP